MKLELSASIASIVAVCENVLNVVMLLATSAYGSAL